MSDAPFDAAAGHLHFAPACFNRAWRLLEQPSRTAADDDEMLQVAMTSLWHWSQRPDCRPRNKAVGCWLISRVYAVLGNGLESRRFAARCAKNSMGEPPFYMAYAHEALARAALVLGDFPAIERHLAEACALLPTIESPEEQAMLERDLNTIPPFPTHYPPSTTY